MSCELHDWKAYALGELDREARQLAETHASACGHCREELAGLRFTLDSLLTLREEEIPRRIAFVSDKVFEPKWWQKMWTPNFAAACVVGAAILAHGFVRPAAPDNVQLQAQIDTAVQRAVDAKQTEMLAAFDSQLNVFRQVYKNSSGLRY